MLLPSALPCDGSQFTTTQSRRPLLRRFMPFAGSSSSGNMLPTLSIIPDALIVPPMVDATCASGLPSPLLSPASISSGIHSTCRALQSFLGVAPSPNAAKPARRNQIPVPPTSPTRSSRTLPIHEHRVSKRSSPVRLSPPARGKNKRTREDYETSDPNTAMEIDLQNSSSDYISHYGYSFDSGYGRSNSSSPDMESEHEKLFSTPKRRRRLPGPANIPFGLDRQDFADLQTATAMSPQSVRASASLPSPSTPTSLLGEEELEEWWTPVDDAQLVTVVLEKMNLSRRDWEECAKVLGAEGEGGSLGKRWKWLMEEGKIGLKMGIDERGRFEGRRARRRQVRGDIRTVF